MTRRHALPATPIARPLAGLLACAIVVSACTIANLGTSPATPTGGVATAPPSSLPSPEPSAGGLPVASDEAPGGATGDSSLQDVLPDEIDGTPTTKGSMSGTEFLGSGLATPDLEAVLARLDVRPRDISVAFAYTAMGSSGTAVFAFRVPGASEQQLRQALVDGRPQEVRGSTSGSKALGGKPTVTIAGETMPGGRSVYRYAAGSFVFFITAGHESSAGEILAGLP